jgi:predicted nucleic acid-binding protein
MPNSPSPRRLYWDTCLFLDFFTANPSRIATLTDIMRAIQADSNSIIYTSVLTITEVSHVTIEKDQQRLDANIVLRLDSFWNDHSLITIVDLNQVIARIARDLRRQAIPQQWTLRPADAIHLATAYWLKHQARRPVDEVHTYDQKLFKFATLINIPILEPYTPQPPLPGI